jgi:hypothetical protein
MLFMMIGTIENKNDATVEGEECLSFVRVEEFKDLKTS